MCEKLVDLDKIPEQNPFGTYRNWLQWKLQNMVSGDVLRLPIFSDIEIKRFNTGIVVTLSFTNTIYATGVTRCEQLINAIETQDFSDIDPEVSALALKVKVLKLREQGYNSEQIQKELNITLGRLNYSLRRS